MRSNVQREQLNYVKGMGKKQFTTSKHRMLKINNHMVKRASQKNKPKTGLNSGAPELNKVDTFRKWFLVY